jgi:acyl-coenzyme A synthetase/AMP-(fatty) acid ligase
VLKSAAQSGEAELLEHCRDGLPFFKRPRRVLFVDGYPTTATGKIRRVELRAMAASVLTDRAVAQQGAG